MPTALADDDDDAEDTHDYLSIARTPYEQEEALRRRGNHRRRVGQSHSWWKPVLELVIHVLVGSFLFAAIFAPAIGLDLLIHWLKEKYKVSEFLLALLTYMKYFVAGVDAFLYALFILKMAWLFIRNMIWGEPDHDQ